MAVNSSFDGAPLARPFPGAVVLTHFAAAFLALTVVTDTAYLRTTVLMWQDFSSWLLFFGLIAGGIAALFWIIGALTKRARPGWGVLGLYVLALILGFVNSLMHAGDGWTAIMPWGITLSAVTCLVMLGAALLNRRAARRPLIRA
ncbi:hypothetical protein E4L95_18890 [Paracoccus liaowanqingii]|uniref:DUF2231 domain-containing protein n=2 Tax=Paracoccus liaowanqingii TaxID=2560053 RepID=A0A4Z1BZ22_9RHOB|nr:hypothetical protein E4L95_18890 [Paracoccus liaowanqingii]